MDGVNYGAFLEENMLHKTWLEVHLPAGHLPKAYSHSCVGMVQINMLRSPIKARSKLDHTGPPSSSDWAVFHLQNG